MKINFSRNLSITIKLVLSVVVIMFISLIIGTLLLNTYVKSEMTNAYMDAVDNLANSLQEGVRGSLERGQMKNFQKLLVQMKNIKGVDEVTLYDRNFRLNLSSSEKGNNNEVLPDDIQALVQKTTETFSLPGETDVKIYIPQIVEPDCIRCHPGWVENEIGGVMELIYDLTPLYEAISKQRMMLTLGGIVLVLVISILVFLLSRTITNPIVKMTSAMGLLAKGDLEVDIPSQQRSDEIGEMADAMRIFKQNTAERKILESEKKAAMIKADEEKIQLMNKMADDFEDKIGGLIAGVTESVRELEKTASSMSANAHQTEQQSSTVASSAEQTSTNVLTVASSTEQLSASVNEISSQVNQSTQVSSQAVNEADRSNEQIASLSEASQKIGEVVKLISDIADQTNLLALNATIEAARAGESGKGFAVVAGEVKELARQTSAATNSIGEQINDIQNAATDAVDCIQSISSTISTINDIASTIASAVEEQRHVINDITQSTQSAAAGTKDVSSNITLVAEASVETGREANMVFEAASDLSKKAGLLHTEVETFLAQVRSSG